MKNKHGFTYIELIIYLLILSIIITSVVQFGWGAIHGKIKSDIQQEVSYNLRYAMNRIKYEIESADSITINNSSSITLSFSDPTRNQTNILLDNDSIKLGFANDINCPQSSPCSLTNETITVTEFTILDQSSSGSESQLIRIIITAGNENSELEQYNHSETYSTSLELN